MGIELLLIGSSVCALLGFFAGKKYSVRNPDEITKENKELLNVAGKNNKHLIMLKESETSHKNMIEALNIKLAESNKNLLKYKEIALTHTVDWKNWSSDNQIGEIKYSKTPIKNSYNSNIDGNLKSIAADLSVYADLNLEISFTILVTGDWKHYLSSQGWTFQNDPNLLKSSEAISSMLYGKHGKIIEEIKQIIRSPLYKFYLDNGQVARNGSHINFLLMIYPEIKQASIKKPEIHYVNVPVVEREIQIIEVEKTLVLEKESGIPLFDDKSLLQDLIAAQVEIEVDTRLKKSQQANASKEKN